MNTGMCRRLAYAKFMNPAFEPEIGTLFVSTSAIPFTRIIVPRVAMNACILAPPLPALR